MVFTAVLALLVPARPHFAHAQGDAARPAADLLGSLPERAPRAINLRLRTAASDGQHWGAAVEASPQMPPHWTSLLTISAARDVSASAEPSIERLPLPEPAQDTPPTSPTSAFRERPLAELDTNIRPPAGQLPENATEPRFPEVPLDMQGPYAARNWGQNRYCWEAPVTCHHPLYFEDINLERHGHQVPYVQPIISAAHFFGRVPALPYLMALDCSWNHQYALGHGRPGTCEPCPIRLIPVTIGPSAVQAAVVTGLILAIP